MYNGGKPYLKNRKKQLRIDRFIQEISINGVI